MVPLYGSFALGLSVDVINIAMSGHKYRLSILTNSYWQQTNVVGNFTRLLILNPTHICWRDAAKVATHVPKVQ